MLPVSDGTSIEINSSHYSQIVPRASKITFSTYKGKFSNCFDLFYAFIIKDTYIQSIENTLLEQYFDLDADTGFVSTIVAIKNKRIDFIVGFCHI